MAARRGRGTDKGTLAQNKGGDYRVYKMDDAAMLHHIAGPDGANLRKLEELLKVSCSIRGIKVHVTAKTREQLDRVSSAFDQFRLLARHGARIDVEQVLAGPEKKRGREGAPTSRQAVPKTEGQREYVQAIAEHDLVFGIGPAGTGKTFLAVAAALQALDSGQVRRLVLTRPAVEAGEHLGFLPGGMAEKIDPYLRPLYDAIEELAGPQRLERMRKDGQIEVAPLAFMRGRTLSGCFILLDEAQNCTRSQIAMLLTRIGHGSKCVVTGDRRQSDIRETSGLSYAVAALHDVEGVSVVELKPIDVQRHPLVARVIDALEAFDHGSSH